MKTNLYQHGAQHSGRHGKRGFTLIELVVVVAVIALLAAIITPLVLNVISDSRITKAQADARAIADAIQKFRVDVGVYPFFRAALPVLKDENAQVSTLKTSGSDPVDGLVTAATWLTVAEATVAPDCGNTPTDDDGTDFDDQLISNTAGYTTSDKPQKSGWKGPYLQSTSEDPWGNRYFVNIIHAASDCTSAPKHAVFVLSAGPDGAFDTAFDIDVTASVVAGGDDILHRIL